MSHLPNRPILCLAFLAASLTGCFGSSLALFPVAVPGQGVVVASAADSVTSEWLSLDPGQIALVREEDVTIALRASAGSVFVTLRLEVTNETEDERIVNPTTIKVLDRRRIELPRARPDEVANRIASEALADPYFLPRYVVETEANTTLVVGSLSANLGETRNE